MVKIKKIQLEIGGKTISITEDEARELKAKLDRLFGTQYIPYPIYPVPYYEPQPFITYSGTGTNLYGPPA